MSQILTGALDLGKTGIKGLTSIIPGTEGLMDNEEEQKRKIEEEAKKKKEEEEKKKRKPLKKGAYQIQVHIIEARDLKGRDKETEFSDPVVKVDIMGVKKHTSIHKTCANCVFDEVLFYEWQNLLPNDVLQAKVRIRVMDANLIRKDALIGSYEFDVGEIYYRKYHELYRQWCALTDPSGDHLDDEGQTLIQGYLKLSITVLGPKDEQHLHTKDEEDDESNQMMSVLMPPQLTIEPMLLVFRIYEAQDLVQADSGLAGDKIDAFFKIDFSGTVDFKSKVIKQDFNPTFNQELGLPVNEPVMSAGISFSCYDDDFGTGLGDRVTTITLNYNEIKENTRAELKNVGPAKWYNLYGAPPFKQRGWGSKMNRGIIPGSYFRGRVLLTAGVREEDKAKQYKADIDPLPIHLRPEEVTYRFQCDIYEGAEIPELGGEMHIEVWCAKHYKISNAKDVEEGRVAWYHVMEDMIASFPVDLKQCPDIFVYLCRGQKKVSFTRLPFARVFHQGWVVPPAWYTLTEDLALDYLSDEQFPGSILMSLRVGIHEECPEEVDPKCRPLKHNLAIERSIAVPHGATSQVADTRPRSIIKWKKKPREVAKAGSLKVTLVEARDLAAKDSGGTSDPYCRLRIDGTEYKSKVIDKTLNPKWDQVFNFPEVSIESTLFLTIKDDDFNFGLIKNDLIGTVDIDLRSVAVSSGRAMGLNWDYESWYMLSNVVYDEEDNKGINHNPEIHLKFEFQYFDKKTSRNAIKRIAKARKDKENSLLAKLNLDKDRKDQSIGSPELGYPMQGHYQLRARIYLARNLIATDSNGSADPYVVIRLAGKKIKTDYIQDTTNPQWYQTLTIITQIPEPMAIAPKIQLTVYDKDTFGKDDRLGRTTIDCADARANFELEDPHNVEPQWYQLYNWENQAIRNCRILASFQLVQGNERKSLEHDPMPDIQPETTLMYLDVLSLGCRDLSSILGVHKPYVSFEMPNGKKYKTESSCHPSSTNPNFLQLLKIPVEIPTKTIFAPTVDIWVSDTMFGGLIKRHIGSSALDLSQFLEEDPVTGGIRPHNQKISLQIGEVPEIKSPTEIEAEETEARLKAQRKELLAAKLEEADAREELRQHIEQLEKEDDEDAQAEMEEDQEDAMDSYIANYGHEGNDVELSRISKRLSRSVNSRASRSSKRGKRGSRSRSSRSRKSRRSHSPSQSKSHSYSQKIEYSRSHQSETDRLRAALAATKRDEAIGIGDLDEEALQALDLAEEDQKQLHLEEGLLDEKKGDEKDAKKHIGEEGHGFTMDDDGRISLDSGYWDEEDGEDSSSDDGFGFGPPPSDPGEYHPLLKDERENKVPTDKEFKVKDTERYDISASMSNTDDFVPDYMRGRATVDDELEDFIDCSPFYKIPLYTGQQNAGFFQESFRQMGTWKGLIHIRDDKNAEPSTDIADYNEVLVPKERFVRLYLLRGINLSPRDRSWGNGVETSDPYIIIKCGKTKLSTRDRYIPNTNDPEFYESFEFPATLPGDTTVRIELWDWDGIGDDLIGFTEIDLEDRWFSKNWRELKLKPLEHRTLHLSDSLAPQGKIELWLDIMATSQAKESKMWDITPKPPEDYEMRVIIWGCREVTIKDEFTNQNDLFITATLSTEDGKRQSTDTHLRSKKGKGNFNWRMKWPLSLPLPKNQWPRLRLQIWDFDFFSFDDSICEAVLTLKGLCKRTMKSGKRIQLWDSNSDQKDKTKFWLENLQHPNYEGNQGKMLVSIELMPKSLAETYPAGFGRSDPNQNPFLPEPEGRVNWSLFHPLDMLKEILGESLYRKCCCAIFCILILAACVMMAPTLASNILTKILTPD